MLGLILALRMLLACLDICDTSFVRFLGFKDQTCHH